MGITNGIRIHLPMTDVAVFIKEPEKHQKTCVHRRPSFSPEPSRYRWNNSLGRLALGVQAVQEVNIGEYW